MLRTVKLEHLPHYLEVIRSTFPFLKPGVAITREAIAEYYRQSFVGYHLFHSSAGAVHMAISDGDTFNKNDYFAQAEFIVSLAASIGQSGTLLEAGCGKGFNIGFLADELPGWRCIGLDLTDSHIKWAKNRFGSHRNAAFIEGDFQNIGTAHDGALQIVFFVESLCHAQDMPAVLRSAFSSLGDNGLLVVFDGFRSNKKEFSRDLFLAADLVESAMAVPRFVEISLFHEYATAAGFVIESSDNISTSIMPNLLRLADFAKSFFKFQSITQILKRVLPSGLLCNAVAGLLMPITVSSGVHEYRRIVLRKQRSH